MTKKTNQRKDFTQRAFDVFQQAIGEAEPEEDNTKNKVLVEYGKDGGAKGGRARAEKLTPEERSEIARKAANKRWSKE